MVIENKTVAEMVTENYKTADVFKKNGIDFCCGGKVTVEDICKKKGINYDKLVDELNAVERSDEQDHNYQDWRLDHLIDHILETQHAYIEQHGPVIMQYANKVALVHGNAQPETVEIRDYFDQLLQELISHMAKEENILFPYIKQLVLVSDGMTEFSPPPFGTIQHPIKMMEHEHDGAGDLCRKISELSGNYIPPAHACNTYRVLYLKLKEFEENLHLHVHMENNILFPSAIELERSFL